MESPPAPSGVCETEIWANLQLIKHPLLCLPLMCPRHLHCTQTCVFPCQRSKSLLMWAGGRRGYLEKWQPESTETSTGRLLFRATTFWCPAKKPTGRRSPVSPPTTTRSARTASPLTFSVSFSQTQEDHEITGEWKHWDLMWKHHFFVIHAPDEPDVTVDGFDGNWYLNRENVQLSCQADANPAVSLYQWKLWVQLFVGFYANVSPHHGGVTVHWFKFNETE